MVRRRSTLQLRDDGLDALGGGVLHALLFRLKPCDLLAVAVALGDGDLGKAPP